MLEKKKLTITLPKPNRNKVIRIKKIAGRQIIVYSNDDINLIKISGIKNIFKMIWYNIIYFLKGEIEIKC